MSTFPAGLHTVFPRINAWGVYFKIRDFRGAFIRGGRLLEGGGRLFQIQKYWKQDMDVQK